MTSSLPKKAKKICLKSQIVRDSKNLWKVDPLQKMTPPARSRRSICQYLKWWHIRYPISKSSSYYIIFMNNNILNSWMRANSSRPSSCCRRSWCPGVLLAKTSPICSNWLAWSWTSQWGIISCNNQIPSQTKLIRRIKTIRLTWRLRMKKICKSMKHRINRRLRHKTLQPSSLPNDRHYLGSCIVIYLWIKCCCQIDSRHFWNLLSNIKCINVLTTMKMLRSIHFWSITSAHLLSCQLNAWPPSEGIKNKFGCASSMIKAINLPPFAKKDKSLSGLSCRTVVQANRMLSNHIIDHQGKLDTNVNWFMRLKNMLRWLDVYLGHQMVTGLFLAPIKTILPGFGTSPILKRLRPEHQSPWTITWSAIWKSTHPTLPKSNFTTKA